VDDSSITSSGAVCQVSGDALGATLVFSLCDYEDIFTMLGGFILGFAYLSAFLIIVKR